MSDSKFDIVCIGRSSIDLYSNDIGAPFEQITSFAAFVGGCPTNISVGVRRLGLKSALLTGVGEDKVGDFILHYLRKEQVDVSLTPKKPGRRSSAVVLGIEPPDTFPLVFYRDNCADIAITIEDIRKIPFDSVKSILVSGTGLSLEPSRSATLYAAEEASRHGTKVILDIDFRSDQWPDLQTFGTTIRSILPNIDIMIGTETEVKAAAYIGSGHAKVKEQSVSDSHIEADLNESIDRLMKLGPGIMILKNGPLGSIIYELDKESVAVPGFKVQITNVLGAGDAFASGFIFGYLSGWSLFKSCRLGNACGAILVTQHGCSNFSPTMDEVMNFANSQGGL
jgi:5-dehydro-2-deoxygluconokinase